MIAQYGLIISGMVALIYWIIGLLYGIDRIELNIDLNQIIEYQVKCLKNGINGVGIPDLIIIQNNCKIYSLDKHFQLMQFLFDFDLVASNI